MSEFVGVKLPYGDAKPGVNYKIIQQGADYVSIQCKGRPLCVPKGYITSPTFVERENYEPTYEDIVAKEMSDLGL
jgi:hypothetical protein